MIQKKKGISTAILKTKKVENKKLYICKKLYKSQRLPKSCPT
jgi:hypothetical protein